MLRCLLMTQYGKNKVDEKTIGFYVRKLCASRMKASRGGFYCANDADIADPLLIIILESKNYAGQCQTPNDTLAVKTFNAKWSKGRAEG